MDAGIIDTSEPESSNAGYTLRSIRSRMCEGVGSSVASAETARVFCALGR